MQLTGLYCTCYDDVVIASSWRYLPGRCSAGVSVCQAGVVLGYSSVLFDMVRCRISQAHKPQSIEKTLSQDKYANK